MKKALQIILGLTFLLLSPLALEASKAMTSDKGPVVRYYPNPVQKTLNLEIQFEFSNQYQSVEVKIVNLLGQEMIQPISVETRGLMNEIRVDMSNIPSGVYFLEIYSTVDGNTTKQTRKITKN